MAQGGENWAWEEAEMLVEAPEMLAEMPAEIPGRSYSSFRAQFIDTEHMFVVAILLLQTRVAP